MQPAQTPSPTIERYLSALRHVFRGAPSKHEAHRRSRSILEDLSSEQTLLTQLLGKLVATPGVLARANYPVVGFELELNEDFALVMNGWIPLPDRQTDVATKSIHHHGNMLLTTTTVFGPGYEHWTFTSPEPVDPERGLFQMRVTERAAHPLHHTAFVDHHIPHLPVYPSGLSITLALWSNRFPTTWRDRLKRVPLLQRNAKLLRDLGARAGLTRFLDLKVIDYFDFFPLETGGFQGMRERQEFPLGPNEDFLFSLFHLVQSTGNEALASRIKERIAAETLPNPALALRLVSDLERGTPIEGRLSTGHTGVPHANFRTSEIERALASGGRPGVASVTA
jgi:hypothetical protein